ncbi:transglycosylase SLT domain-containing protein [Sciscionella sediminilitoris]|uniref:transglycosylase SLT domain-containing protein n=1 Tax=Sciscionella sediminilitoris TaxID=1445613 RepID=UPI000690D423|nr:transglycosylase SLT domain-containing protein [Sciscionella sp. SE31]
MGFFNKLIGAGVFFGTIWIATQVQGSIGETSESHDTSGGGPSSVSDIPSKYLAAYKSAAGTCSHLDWALLAGIGKVETNHGRSHLPGVSSGTNSAGAAGPMQFLKPTFNSVRSKHSDVGSDIYDPDDAAKAAAHYLCDSGLASGNEYNAIYTYNHAGWYVAQVRSAAAEYRSAA